MNYTMKETPEEVAQLVANEIKQLLLNKPDALICLCGGHTPIPVFRQLIKDAKANEFPSDAFKFILLDEWVGLGIDDEGSCSYDLSTQFLNPLNVPLDDRVFLFDGLSDDFEKECQKAQQFIERNNGIDLVLLGVGMNGHIGFNEPGSEVDDGIRVVELSEKSKEVGKKYFKANHDLTHGITLGIREFLNAKRLLILALGAHKKEIVEQTVHSEKNVALPVTLIKDHKNVHLYLDELAAQNL